MAGVVKKRLKSGKYRAWFVDALGRQKWFVGTRSKSDTLSMARDLEDDHTPVRLGCQPGMKAADRHKVRPFAEVKEEYLAWGEAGGGRHGLPWGKAHAQHRRSGLAFWQQRLSLVTLVDVYEIQGKVEALAREERGRGLAPASVAHTVESLSAFCDWCCKRSYLSEDPLKHLARMDVTPQSRRRAMTAGEIQRLLEHCAPWRRVTYEVAFLTGLRVRELRMLAVQDLDVEYCTLHLHREWTKNRKQGEQPLPQSLVARLQAFAQTGEVQRLYARFYRRKDGRNEAPENALLYVPKNAARAMYDDLEAAGVPRETPAGRLDFHSARVAFINLVLDSGTDVKTAQSLSRHSTPQLTMGTYARVWEDTRAKTIEKVGEALFSDANQVHSKYALAAGAEGLVISPCVSMGSGKGNLVEMRGFEPPTSAMRVLRSPN